MVFFLCDAIKERWPILPMATVYKLVRAARDCGDMDSVTAVLSLTDEELLSCRGFGQKALAEWRAVVPSPVIDPWREHAEMLAGVR